MSRHAATHERQITPGALTERPVVARRRLRRLTKWLVSVGVAVTLLVLGLQWALHRPYFRVEQVVVTGNVHESVAAVLGRSGLSSHPSMVNLNESLIKERLETLPWVASVTITKKWPHTVELAIHENVAVAVAFSASHVLEYVDAKGRALSRAPLHENLPTLQFLGATSTSWPYQSVGRAAAYVASQLPVAFASQVSTITDDPQGSVTLEMTTPVTFVVGPATNLHAKFVAIASVIAHSTLVPGDVVDVTVPDELAVTPPSG
ncbi:MAG TPA: FtsQ-type POTRA domain-containing protein [Acidimicrobiales bacterium]|nr:FtsQ-type POTRA domain-containing protein [Acidimicrobiales bacterium]